MSFGAPPRPLGYHGAAAAPRGASAPEATKGHTVPQPKRSRISAPHALGLFVFLACAAVLVALLIARLAAGIGSLEKAATAFSLAVGAIACVAMLIDAVDAWVTGGMTPQGRRMVRSLVSIALIAAVATSVLGRNLPLMLILGPALVVYLLIARRSLVGASAPRHGADAGSTAADRPSTPRSRQRRGGKKRK